MNLGVWRFFRCPRCKWVPLLEVVGMPYACTRCLLSKSLKLVIMEPHR